MTHPVPPSNPASGAPDTAAPAASIGPGPLSTLRVVELHAIGPVPFAGQLLRGLGAQVLRVSPPDDPGLGVAVPPTYDCLNDGKAQAAIDLKRPEGREALHEHLAGADVLLEGFRPGVLERLGLAPAALLQRHPRLVIGRLSGWGADGEMAPRAGHDINYLAMSGLLHAIGTADAPLPPLNVVADFGGGAMHLAVGVLARLVARGAAGGDGRGGVVETSILGGSVGLTGMFYGLIAGGVWSVRRASNLLDGAMPFYRVYRTADDRFVAVGALEPKFYRELLEVLGLAGEIEPREQYLPAAWPDAAARIAARIAEQPRDEWARRAAGRDACLSPVLDFLEAAGHPHNLANGYYDPQAAFPRPGQVLRFTD